MIYPWISLYNWEPFRVDALGLITLLGAEEINAWIGRLVPSRWVEHMPLLAIFVIAGDRFRTKTPSFLLYNISMGIHTTDCAAWFSRWVQCQNFETTRSIVFWEAVETPPRRLLDHFTAICVSVCSMGSLLAMTILMYDMYGVANVCAIIISVFTRAYILSANRLAIDKAIANLGREKDTGKILIITPDSRVITMFIPNEFIVPIFVRNPLPSAGQTYKVVRWVSWLAFGVHVITLGMASLATQICTIFLILVSFILMTRGFGCEDMARPVPVSFDGGGDTQAYTCYIGSHLKATVFEWPSYLEFEQTPKRTWQLWEFSVNHQTQRLRSTRRMDLYAWLNLTTEEEDSLSKWDLLPHKRGDDASWENAFNAKRALIRDHCPNILEIKKRVEQFLEKNGAKTGDQDCDLESQDSQTDQANDPLTLRQPQRITTVLTTSGGVTESL